MTQLESGDFQLEFSKELTESSKNQLAAIIQNTT